MNRLSDRPRPADHRPRADHGGFILIEHMDCVASHCPFHNGRGVRYSQSHIYASQFAVFVGSILGVFSARPSLSSLVTEISEFMHATFVQ